MVPNVFSCGQKVIMDLHRFSNSTVYVCVQTQVEEMSGDRHENFILPV